MSVRHIHPVKGFTYKRNRIFSHNDLIAGATFVIFPQHLISENIAAFIFSSKMLSMIIQPYFSVHLLHVD